MPQLEELIEIYEDKFNFTILNLRCYINTVVVPGQFSNLGHVS